MLDDDAGNTVSASIIDNRIVIGRTPVGIFRPIRGVFRLDSPVVQTKLGQLLQHLLAESVAGNMSVVVIAAVVGHEYFAPLSSGRSGVDMQADEDRRLCRNRLFHPLREAHIRVGRSRHEHVYASPLQSCLTILCNFEINVLFQKSIRSRTWIRAAMTGIKSHDKARRRSPCTSRRTGSNHRDRKGRGFIRR